MSVQNRGTHCLQVGVHRLDAMSSQRLPAHIPHQDGKGTNAHGLLTGWRTPRSSPRRPPAARDPRGPPDHHPRARALDHDARSLWPPMRSQRLTHRHHPRERPDMVPVLVRQRPVQASPRPERPQAPQTDYKRRRRRCLSHFDEPRFQHAILRSGAPGHRCCRARRSRPNDLATSMQRAAWACGPSVPASRLSRQRRSTRGSGSSAQA